MQPWHTHRVPQSILPCELHGVRHVEAQSEYVPCSNVHSLHKSGLGKCPPPWIRIDPVADHIVKENFSITGTTNIRSGEILSVFVYQSPASPNKKRPSEYPDVRGNIAVRAGDCNVNARPFSENLTTLRPSLYTIQVRSYE